KAETPEDKAFLKAAIIAKYGLVSLEGNLGKKALPRLYEVLGKVPLTHTRDNPFLADIKRDKAKAATTEASNYSDRKVALNLAGVDEDFAPLGADDEVPANLRPKKSQANYFTHTTLHELGHAVDDKLKHMNGKAGNAAFGGWVKVKGPEE